MVIVFIMGNLGADPETRFTPSGQKVVNLRLASNSKKQGKDETTWWRVTIFGDRFDKMLTYLKKGSSVIVSGEMSTDLWTDKEGRQHIQHNVIADSIKFSPFGRSDRAQEQSHSQGSPAGYAPAYTQQTENRGYAAPSYAQPQQQSYGAPQAQPYPQTAMHDFSFGDIPSDASLHADHNDETPF